MKKEKANIRFPSTISKMGDNKIIWVPLAVHEMVRDLEGKKLMVTVEESI